MMKRSFHRRCASLVVVNHRTRRRARAGGDRDTFLPAGNWEKRDPASLGLDKRSSTRPSRSALTNENTNTKDLAVDIPNTFRAEAPYNNLIGPTQERAGANVLVIYKGYVVASWGDIDRADMTFSVTKTFLSTVVGRGVRTTA